MGQMGLSFLVKHKKTITPHHPTAPLPSTKKKNTKQLRLVWEARDGLAKRRETRDYKTAKFVEACFEAAPQVSESDDAGQSSTMYLVYYNTPLSFSQSLAAYYFLATREGPKAFRPSAMARAWLSDLSCCPRKAPPACTQVRRFFAFAACFAERAEEHAKAVVFVPFETDRVCFCHEIHLAGWPRQR